MTATRAKNIFYTKKKKSSPIGYENVTPAKVDTSLRNIQYGIDFILSHLEGPLFPRNIMTKRLGCQVEVFNKEELLRYFEWSDYQDCRIAAYHSFKGYNGLNFTPPSLVFIDLDLNMFNDRNTLNKVLSKTLQNITKICDKSELTVLWTGNGYHIYHPLSAPFVLEEEQVFADFISSDLDLTSKFMRFAEQYLTGGKHDQNHKPSIHNCLLRIPWTYNSKNGQQVRIVRQWNGYKTPIQYILRPFRSYLIQQRLDRINDDKAKIKKNQSHFSMGWSHSRNGSIPWIEQMLLQTPIGDNRKYCCWRILAPYLINVKGLSEVDSCNTIVDWLDRCSTIKRLSFLPRYRVKDDIRRAKRIGYYPISLDNLQKENTELYNILMNE